METQTTIKPKITSTSPNPITVTTDNFNRAETDKYFGDFVKRGALGKFWHFRELPSLDIDSVRPNRDTLYSHITPEKNDGTGIYKLNVKDVPVDGFRSISVYNDKGFFVNNDFNAYTLNNITAKKDADGSVTIQFGCDGKNSNFLPITSGWNYMVRLYRPRKEILDGTHGNFRRQNR